jgi:hypothetical protein
MNRTVCHALWIQLTLLRSSLWVVPVHARKIMQEPGKWRGLPFEN